MKHNPFIPLFIVCLIFNRYPLVAKQETRQPTEKNLCFQEPKKAAVTYDLIIIGSGLAGLAAAIQAKWLNLKRVLIIEGDDPGGQFASASTIGNWPGEITIHGATKISSMRAHVEHLGCLFLSDKVISADLKNGAPFAIQTSCNGSLLARAIIVATGSQHKKLNCPGEDTYTGKGVGVCPLCDGPLFSEKPVIVIGGGNMAVEKALFMTKFTDHVTLIHDKNTLKASLELQRKLRDNTAITVIPNSTITEILGDDNQVTAAQVYNIITGQTYQLATEGIIIAVGLTPYSTIFKDQLEINADGYITCTSGTQSSVPGVFVAGSVANKRHNQAMIVIGNAYMAAIDAEKYLTDLFGNQPVGKN